MKKIVRILLIVLGVLIVLMVIIPILFRPRIEAVVKEKINEQVHAEVDWSGIGISLFRGFPDLSVNLRQCYVVGLAPFEGDTLAGIERLEIRVDLLSAIRKDVEVESVILDEPLINAIVLEDGSANWDIAGGPEGVTREEGGLSEAGEMTGEATEETAEEPGVIEEDTEPAEEPGEKAEEPGETAESKGIPVKVRLNRLAIRDGRLAYSDAVSGAEAVLRDLDVELSGDFAMDRTDLNLQMTVEGIDATYGGIRYLKEAFFGLNVIAAADIVNSIYTLKENEIRLNELVLGSEGSVALQEEGAMELDLCFFSRETSFEALLSMVPAIYLREFGSLETSGTLQLEGEVSGTMKDTIFPDAMLTLVVSDGYFSYPDLPKDVSDVQINLQVDYRGTDMDLSTVDLKQFHLLMGGNPFDLSLQVAHPVSDMLVQGMALGKIDFSSLGDVVPLEDIELGGKLTTDLTWNTRISYIEQEQFEKVNVDGNLLVENVFVTAPDIPVPVRLNLIDMDFTPRVVNLRDLDLTMGSSDMRMNGELTNFIPYIFDNQTISGTLNVSSNLLDVNELLPETVRDEAAGTSPVQGPEPDASEETEPLHVGEPEEKVQGPEPDASEETEPLQGREPEETEQMAMTDADTTASELSQDPLAGTAALKIPANIDFNMDLDMKKVLYSDILVENILGVVQVAEGTARLDRLNMDVLDGSVTATGLVDTRGPLPDADLSLEVNGVDIPSSYETFVTVKRLAPMAKFCRGKANVTVQYQSLLDAGFTPLFSTINAEGRVFTRGLEIYNLKSFVQLSELLKSEKFRNMTPDEVDLQFTVLGGRVMVDPFDLKFADSRITVSGSHGIDLTMDYLLDMQISTSDLGEGANEMMQGITALAAGAGLKIPQSDVIRVKARIGGTFGDPEITTDLSENLVTGEEKARVAVEERVQEELDQAEEEVRAEAGQRAEQMIREAEEEAARLIGEARKAGDELVREAELQGERLIEEAGNNPLRQIAAKKAAEELRTQAARQSEKMIREAEEKADAIIEKAREEAGKIED
ncbi:MAG: AsmA-like C-terminal region-containing protein [Bacteroidota bacterium]